MKSWGFPGGAVVRRCKSGDASDTGSIPGSGSFLGIRNGNPYSRILDWRVPWTEESGRPQTTGLQTIRHD